MEAEEQGIWGEDIADALFAGVDLSHLSNDLIASSLLESPEYIEELLAEKVFPMTKDQVINLFQEYETEKLIPKEFTIKNLSEGNYSIEQVTEMLNNTFARMLQHE
ncbi:hypothetical protein SteCoe_20868 [Stentor coeruleus]|uniref:Uncharacterized protein n=1 Tax=Stentor coeruleus TaxID=5963 RepID=A0A1R2BQW0_9CILI|nr:hypothetical protein SteCoe_20868 [Stentor coeruleus]